MNLNFSEWKKFLSEGTYKKNNLFYLVAYNKWNLKESI